MNSTPRIVEHTLARTDLFSIRDVSRATKSNCSQVRHVLHTLEVLNRIKRVSPERTIPHIFQVVA